MISAANQGVEALTKELYVEADRLVREFSGADR
jgi:hypothetical protein